MKNLLYGVGDIGSLKARDDEGSIRPLYTLWSNMLGRCYSKVYQNRQPTYKGCTVSENFKNFEFFTNWCESQVGFGEKGFALDKDVLLKGNKQYHEDLCVFVPRAINSALCTRRAKRGALPIGVSAHCNGYAAYISKYGKLSLLKVSNSVEDVFNVYKTHKELYLKELAEVYKHQIDVRVYRSLYNWNVMFDD